MIVLLHEHDLEELALISQPHTDGIADGRRRGLPPEAATHEAGGGACGVAEPSLTEVDRAGRETSLARCAIFAMSPTMPPGIAKPWAYARLTQMS
jgi:hypothetical protein